MPIKQLKLKDLKAGDIMLKFSDGHLVNSIIELGQKLFGKKENPSVTHAGLMYDNRYIIESQGDGVVANDISVGDKKYGYVVFRCTNANLAAGAAAFAKILFDVHSEKKALKYGLLKAAMSILRGAQDANKAKELEKRLDNILKGKANKFFCSQLVAFVYQFAAEQNGISAAGVFKLKDSLVSPTVLAAELVDSKLFDEVGYLVPNER